MALIFQVTKRNVKINDSDVSDGEWNEGIWGVLSRQAALSSLPAKAQNREDVIAESKNIKTKDDAIEFVKKYGGDVKKFEKAYSELMERMEAQNRRMEFEKSLKAESEIRSAMSERGGINSISASIADGWAGAQTLAEEITDSFHEPSAAPEEKAEKPAKKGKKKGD